MELYKSAIESKIKTYTELPSKLTTYIGNKQYYNICMCSHPYFNRRQSSRHKVLPIINCDIGDFLPENIDIRLVDCFENLEIEDIKWIRSKYILALDTEGQPPSFFQLGNSERIYIFGGPDNRNCIKKLRYILNKNILLLIWGGGKRDQIFPVQYFDVQQKYDGKGLKSMTTKYMVNNSLYNIVRPHHRFYDIFNPEKSPTDVFLHNLFAKKYAAADVFFTYQLWQLL